VKLYRNYRSKGLVFLPISADSSEDLAGKVERFLRKSGVDFAAYICPDGDQTDYITALDPSWEGALPRTYVLDRQGRVIKTIAGRIDYTRMDALIRKLLATPAPSQGSRPAEHRKGILVS
jgi:hypothetical protein